MKALAPLTVAMFASRWLRGALPGLALSQQRLAHGMWTPDSQEPQRPAVFRFPWVASRDSPPVRCVPVVIAREGDLARRLPWENPALRFMTPTSIGSAAPPVLMWPSNPFPASVPQLPVAAAPVDNSVILRADVDRAAKERFAAFWTSVAERAGEHAAVFAPLRGRENTNDLITRALRDIFDNRPNTLRKHANYFWRYEEYQRSRGRAAFPLDAGDIAEWLFELRDGGCGPTVPLACSDALRFACSHLEMPDVTRHQVVSRQVLAHQRATARPLKPARPPAPEHVSLLEYYINNATVPIERRWTAAVVWLQVFAALRFDDAQHSSPGELRFTEQGIFGRSSTSKTDKFNRGSLWVAPATSISGLPMVQIIAAVWDAFRATLPPGALPDYLLALPPSFELGGRVRIAPADHAAALVMTRDAWRGAGVPADIVAEFTLHTPRHAFVSWGADLGIGWTELAELGRWRDPMMAKRYADEALTVPVRVVSRTVAAVRAGFAPRAGIRDLAAQDDELDRAIAASAVPFGHAMAGAPALQPFAYPMAAPFAPLASQTAEPLVAEARARPPTSGASPPSKRAAGRPAESPAPPHVSPPVLEGAQASTPAAGVLGPRAESELTCPHCGRVYRYKRSFDKHVRACSAAHPGA